MAGNSRGGNPFDLSRKVAAGAVVQPLAREWTEAEQAQKLVGYIEISEPYWEHIRFNSHVRYYSKTGGFRPGGFVVENPGARVEAGSAEPAKKVIRLKNGFTPQAMTWAVEYDDIERIFVKADAVVLELKHDFDRALESINANMQKLAAHIVSLRDRS